MFNPQEIHSVSQKNSHPLWLRSNSRINWTCASEWILTPSEKKQKPVSISLWDNNHLKYLVTTKPPNKRSVKQIHYHLIMKRELYMPLPSNTSSTIRHQSLLLQNSSVVEPVSDIQKDKHHWKQQPGEKLHSIENPDIVILRWRLLGASALARSRHSLHLRFPWYPDRLLTWRGAATRRRRRFVIIDQYLCCLGSFVLEKHQQQNRSQVIVTLVNSR